MSKRQPKVIRPPRGMLMLPCLRCNQLKVIVLAATPFERTPAQELICGDDECNAVHYFGVSFKEGTFLIHYSRDTRRYQLDNYEERPDVIVRFGRLSKVELENIGESEPFGRGPIFLLRRRKVNSSEVRSIWERSKGCCHICGKKWKLNERGINGWHVDHRIPNSHGGADTEDFRNLKVACAPCNLRKGDGHPERLVEIALSQHIVFG